MASELVKPNYFLINAPAGSGKTTNIKKEIRKIVTQESAKRILCITYTNRAADELKKELVEDTVYINTIHSFLSEFMEIYFKNDRVIELFFEVYSDQINTKIEKDTKEKSEGRKSYIEKYGQLDYETVKNNIFNKYKISYNELPFNSLYYGGICHDDLISFSRVMVSKFSAIKRRLKNSYQYVFIDEYQDTATDVLNLFYYTLYESNTKLFLYGDRMQQIYDNYDGSFEDRFEKFDSSKKLRVNYRSSVSIIKVLNGIYNNDEYNQISNEKSNFIEVSPKLIISASENYSKISTQYPEYLKLYIVNKEKYKEIGAVNLYDKISSMEQYRFGRKYSVNDVLMKEMDENPDLLFKTLLLLGKMYGYYENENYGKIMQLIKYGNGKKIINKKLLLVNFHKDKKIFVNTLEIIKKYFTENMKVTIKQYLQILINCNLILKECVEEIFIDERYKSVLEVSFWEFVQVYNLHKEPNVSTQHGVKGEGYENVCFFAEDNLRIDIDMYGFLKLWSESNVEFLGFQKFYYQFMIDINEFESMNDLKISKMKEREVKQNCEIMKDMAEAINKKYKNNEYYKKLCKDNYLLFVKNFKAIHFKDMFNIIKIKRIFNAYKLFYVGCSRAKERLIVVIDDSKVDKFKDKLTDKFKKIGFEL
ncbi:MAG: AAA family ATPase [Bacilli bacterium]|nr:AAA family ATPase [Bacilli bacterium]